MPSVLSMLTRVAKLEAARVAPKSPFELAFGSLAAFEDSVMADIAAGKLDGIDMPLVLNAVRNWHRDRLWGAWNQHRNGAWEYGGRQ